MNLLKIFLVAEVLGDDDPILKAREKRKQMMGNSLKDRWNRAIRTPLFLGTVFMMVVIGFLIWWL